MGRRRRRGCGELSRRPDPCLRQRGSLAPSRRWRFSERDHKRRAAPARQRLQHLHPGPDDLLAGDHGPAAPAGHPGRARPADPLRQRRLRDLPDRLRVQPRRVRSRSGRTSSASGAGWTCSGRSRASASSRFTALFRLARLSRLARITRLLRGQAGKDLVLDVLKNRSQYATFITILLAGIDARVASILVLEFESRSPTRTPTSRPAAMPSGGAS